MSDGLREMIAELVRRGEQLETIETELLTPRPGLDDDERAALWLFAWLECETTGRRFARRPAGASDSSHAYSHSAARASSSRPGRGVSSSASIVSSCSPLRTSSAIRSRSS